METPQSKNPEEPQDETTRAFIFFPLANEGGRGERRG
jgi:hypothetical protein